MPWNDRIGRRIKLSDLHILLAVAQRGSMAKAASELFHLPTGRVTGDQRTGTHPRCPSAGAEPARYRAHAIRTYDAQLRPCRIRRSTAGRRGDRIPRGPDGRRSSDRRHYAAACELRLNRHRAPASALSAHGFQCGDHKCGCAAAGSGSTQPGPSVPAEVRSLCRRPSDLRSSVRQPIFRGRGREKSMDAPTARRACQAHRRILGTSAVRHSVWLDCQRHLWFQGAALSSRVRRLVRPRNDGQSAQDGPLSGHPCQVRVGLSRQTSAHQEIAGRTAKRHRAHWNTHVEGSRA